MFDIGPSELLVIFVVALLVIGPERLPSAVKTASLWIGRFRRSFHKIKAEVERELNADEIRRQLHNESIMAEVEDAKKQAQEFARDVETTANLEDAAETGDKNPADSEPNRSGGNPDLRPQDQADPQGSTTGSDTATSSVKKEVRQAVNYVNDISREVKATGKEIEDEFNKVGPSNKSSPVDKS